MKKIVIGTALFFAFTLSVQAQTSWNYTTYAELKNSSGTLFTIEYGIHPSGYNGRVVWKITNHTNTTLYNVRIARGEYTLSDGRRVERTTGNIGRMDPGQSKTSSQISINTGENYGAWSDQNDNPVIRISLDTPMVLFSTERSGPVHDWGTYGTVVRSD